MQLTAILSDAFTASPAGTARFGSQLTAALIASQPQEWLVQGYSHRLTREQRLAALDESAELPPIAESPLGRRFLARAWDLPIASGPATDVLFAPSLFAPIAGPSRGRRDRLIVTIHDLVAFTHPHTLSAHGARWHRRQIERARRRADVILVPSHAVATALEHYAPAGERVHVVAGAASAIIGNLSHSNLDGAVDRPYILFVGTLEPRKGLDLLIAAMAQPAMRDRATAAVRLVIAGSPGWGGIDLRDYAHRAGLDPARLEITGRVNDERLAGLMRGARALVVPSRVEGFGLPVVEAMAVGTPVIHSLDPALSETAGGAGLGVDLTGGDELAARRLAGAIAEVLTAPGLALSLSELGRSRAAEFSWTESARRLWQLALG